MERSEKEILSQARRLWRAAPAWQTPKGAGFAKPLAVRHAGGGLESWLAPLVAGDRLTGYLRLEPDLSLREKVSFMRRPGELGDCPEAAWWLDPGHARKTAAGLAGPGEELGQPVLTYDQAPSRLAWAVPLVTPAGGRRLIMVAGRHAYEQEDLAGVIG
ncbi:hypothetical protein AAU61_12305 [Desulfocarbo indianensis]|nr:hypothetical protein AAU61_12305 [Desulfocarbo indianensis]